MLKLVVFVYLTLIVYMSLTWAITRIFKNPSIVDVSWSLGLILSGLIYLSQSNMNTRICVISGLLLVWGLRLAGYLWYTRARLGHVDKRYLELSNGWKIAQSLGFFLNFQLQGLFILILSSVFLFAANQSPSSLSWIDYIGCLLVIIGIIGESLADQQLYQFKQQHKGKVCDIGFWAYSRHPNYLFELIVWCGFACFSLQHKNGWIGIISPIWLYIIFTKMTIPITERSSIKSRGQSYLDYQKTTPMFFPKFIR